MLLTWAGVVLHVTAMLPTLPTKLPIARRNHYYDSTAQMAMQQHVVEHGEHDKAQKKSWSSTASGLSSRCPDTVLPLDLARSG